MDRTNSVTKQISNAEKYEAYFVSYRKSYDKHRDSFLAKKREKYVPTGRSVGIPRKERVVKSVEVSQVPMEILSISC